MLATADDPTPIAQRDLRNDSGGILARVDSGEHFVITVRGRAVATLSPILQRRRFVPWAELDRILRRAPLDLQALRDIDEAVDQSTDP